MRWIEADSPFSDSSAAKERRNTQRKINYDRRILKTSPPQDSTSEPKSPSEHPVLKDRKLELFKDVYNMSLTHLLTRNGQHEDEAWSTMAHDKAAFVAKLQNLKAAIDKASFPDFMGELYPATTFSMNEAIKLRKKNKEEKTVNEFEKKSIVLLKQKSTKNSWLYSNKLCDLLLYSVIHQELNRAIGLGYKERLTSDETQYINSRVYGALSKEVRTLSAMIEDLDFSSELKQITLVRLEARATQLKISWVVNGIYLAGEVTRISDRIEDYKAELAQCEKKQRIINEAYNSITLNDLREQFEKRLETFDNSVKYAKPINKKKTTGIVSIGDMMLTPTKTVLGYILEAYRIASINTDKKSLYMMAEEALIHEARYKINESHSGKQPWELVTDLLSESKQLPWELLQLLMWYVDPGDQPIEQIRSSCYSYSSDKAISRDNIVKRTTPGNEPKFVRFFLRGVQICMKPFFDVDIFKTRGAAGTVLAYLLLSGENSQLMIKVVCYFYYLSETGSMGCSDFYRRLVEAIYSVETHNSMVSQELEPYERVLSQAKQHLDIFKNEQQQQNKKITSEEVPLISFDSSTDYSSTLSF